MSIDIRPSEPKNTNFLHQSKFVLAFRKIPTATYMVSQANIPSVSVKNFEAPNLVNRINVGGTKVDYQDFTMTFRVDEDLVNYKEIFNWLTGIGAPESPEQFKRLIQENTMHHNKPGYDIYSDARLKTLTNVYNYNLTILFKDLYPVSLSGIEFIVADAVHAQATATFKYLSFSFDDEDTW